MTLLDFRKNAVLTSRMRELLEDPTLKLAMEVLRDSNPPIDPKVGADPIESVRVLSQMVGYNTYPAALQECAEPFLEPVEVPEEYKPEVE